MARELLCGHHMAMTRAPSPDLVTLASLHAALDGIVEIEALVGQLHLPIDTLRTGKRLHLLVTEMRSLLVDLLRPERR
jgi:hypothetical protein